MYAPAQALGALKRRKYWDAKWKLGHIFLWRDIEKGIREYIPFLEELEEGLYDGGGRLIEEKLIERVRKDPRWTFQAGNRAIETLGVSPVELPIPKQLNITCVPPRFLEHNSA